eukprot:6181144-Pleurochrysis_carterae.AAC.2
MPHIWPIAIDIARRSDLWCAVGREARRCRRSPRRRASAGPGRERACLAAAVRRVGYISAHAQTATAFMQSTRPRSVVALSEEKQLFEKANKGTQASSQLADEESVLRASYLWQGQRAAIDAEEIEIAVVSDVPLDIAHGADIARFCLAPLPVHQSLWRRPLVRVTATQVAD